MFRHLLPRTQKTWTRLCQCILHTIICYFRNKHVRKRKKKKTKDTEAYKKKVYIRVSVNHSCTSESWSFNFPVNLTDRNASSFRRRRGDADGNCILRADESSPPLPAVEAGPGKGSFRQAYHIGNSGALGPPQRLRTVRVSAASHRSPPNSR